MKAVELEFLTEGLSAEMREQIISAWYRLGEGAEQTFPATLAITLLSAARSQALNAKEILNFIEKATEILQASHRVHIKEIEQVNQEQVQRIEQITQGIQEVRKETEKRVQDMCSLVDSLLCSTMKMQEQAKKLQDIQWKNVLILLGVAFIVGGICGMSFDFFN